MGNGGEAGGEEPQRRLLDLKFEILRQTFADLAFDDQPRIAVGHAKKSIEDLIRRDGVAVAGEHLGVRAAGDDFAVDENAVAIKDDELDKHEYADGRYCASSSSGTQ